MRLVWTVAIVLGLAAGGVYWMVHRGLGARDQPSLPETWIANFLRDQSIPSRSAEIPNPIPCSTANLAEARAHWADHCATCHANNGSGETMFGRNLYPRPPDMRQASTQNKSDGTIYYIIKNGVRLSGMPAFGEPGDGDEASWKLVCFVRHLTAMAPEEERDMRNLNPKTPAELEEERQEQEFLNGGDEAPHQHHH